MYWVVISLQFSFEAYFGFLVMFLPFFQMFRFFFILWLVLPQTQGAGQIYLNHIAPFLEHNEGRIDSYVYTAHEKIVTLGSEYLSKLAHYAREYVSHFFLKTEIHPYVPPATAAAANTNAHPPSSNYSAAGSTYIDNFFSKFKQPPTLASLDDSETPLDSQSDAVGGDPSVSTLWGSVFKAGAAAIQTTLQLPKVNSAGSNLATSNYHASGSAIGSFGDIMGKLDQQLFTKNAGPLSSVPAATSSTEPSLTVPRSRVPSGPIPKTPSTSSLVDFDVIKHDESVYAEPDEDENASLLNKNPSEGSSRRRSSSLWNFWGGNTKDNVERDDVLPKNPVKLE